MACSGIDYDAPGKWHILFLESRLDQQEVAMTKKIILFTAAGGIALAAGALALPCWAQEDAGEGIARGVMGGLGSEGHERRVPASNRFGFA
jgi:hypothetical protein